MAKKDPARTIIGRIVPLTSDKEFIAINIPKNAKKPAIMFTGEAPYLSYKVGTETKKLDLGFGNLKVIKGSRVVGSFDGETYDKQGLAELYRVPVEKVTDATHLTCLNQISGGNIYFKNPFTKPKSTVPQDAPEYQQWANAEEGIWDKVLIVYLFDAQREEERLASIRNATPKETTANATEEREDETTTEEMEVTAPESNPIADEIEKQGYKLGDQLFETGVLGYVNGLNWGMGALREKKLKHLEFKRHAISLFKYAYEQGQQANTGLLQPLILFLESEKKTLTSTLSTKGLGLSEEHAQRMRGKIETIDGLIELVDNLFGPPTEEDPD